MTAAPYPAPISNRKKDVIVNKPILVALLLGTMTLAACSKSSDESAAPAASDAAAASTPAPASTVTLSLIHI